MPDQEQTEFNQETPRPGDEPELEAFPVEEPLSEDAFSGDDLELAYQRALESIQSWDPPQEGIAEPVVAEEAEESESSDAIVESEVTDESNAEVSVPVIESHVPVQSGDVADAKPSAIVAEQTEVISSAADAAEEFSLIEPATATIPISAIPQGKKAAEIAVEESRVTPAQVLEAVLFVGGPPLTAKKLSGLLRGSNDTASVERLVDDLNQDYTAQHRPYEIRLGDGGYRIDLRPEFEKLRLRVFGSGPREVRLSQELLEMLALVAYKQPISVAEIEELGRKAPEAQLRQLLRRELIALRRSESNPKEVRYHTTSRFLSLFGLGSLDELPQPEDVDLK